MWGGGGGGGVKERKKEEDLGQKGSTGNILGKINCDTRTGNCSCSLFWVFGDGRADGWHLRSSAD